MVRLVTYNVRRCLGMDGVLSPRRIARVLLEAEADIVALQELDVGRTRSHHADQAQEIADEIGMRLHFHPSLRVEQELYGDAILSRLPMRLVRAAALPGHPRRLGIEPRGALWAEVDAGNVSINVINTHLGLYRRERHAQVEALLGPDWLGHPGCRERTFLVGDLNLVPQSRTYRRLTLRMTDAHRAAGLAPRATFPSYLPVLRLDYVLAGPGIDLLRAEVVRTTATRTASDHLPLAVDFSPADGARQEARVERAALP